MPKVYSVKKFLFLFIYLLPSIGISQELIAISDTTNGFEIGVPTGWKYGIPKDKSLAFIAISQKTESNIAPRENFNINIVNVEGISAESSYQIFLKSIGKAEGFKILEEGEIKINGTTYKILIETHKNHLNQEDMHNFVVFTNKEGRSLILTMVTTSLRYKEYEPLFTKIMKSLKY